MRGTQRWLKRWKLGAKVERLKKYDSMCSEELLEIVKGGPRGQHSWVRGQF